MLNLKTSCSAPFYQEEQHPTKAKSPFQKAVSLILTFGVLVKVFRELFVCFRTEGVIFEAVEMDTCSQFY